MTPSQQQVQFERAATYEFLETRKEDGDLFPDNPLSVRDWPQPLAPEGLHGLAGDFVRVIEPHTEADPAALLVQFLAAFGSVIGRRAYFQVEADRHYGNLAVTVVGSSSKARKGTSQSHIERILSCVDEDWSRDRKLSGLASGEGLIWAVRDPIEQQEAIREQKRVTGYQTVQVDPGVDHKRLLVVEPEFARVLQVCERPTNTLSATIRQAWDTGNLRTLTKTSPAKATGAHISIVGHITTTELQRLLTATQSANGFANRFLWVCARRSKLLPEGGRIGDVDFAPLIYRLCEAVSFARDTEEVKRDDAARAIWIDTYALLSRERLGLLGAVTSRAEAQAVRLSLLYALLDCSDTIRAEHVNAALAVWSYCEASARFVFGDTLGDAAADAIVEALHQMPTGLTRTDISRTVFQRHKSTGEINRALRVLIEGGLVHSEKEETGGRPSERFLLSTPTANKAKEAN